jgi:hypothetical protein
MFYGAWHVIFESRAKNSRIKLRDNVKDVDLQKSTDTSTNGLTVKW